MNRMKVVGPMMVAALIFSGCKIDTNPVKFNFSVPQADTVSFGAELTQRYGVGLDGDLVFDPYGSIYLRPETSTSGFQFGFSVKTAVFLRESWVNYHEVSTLPTGAAFPSFIRGPVVDVVIPSLNTEEVDWHLYFGVRDQFSVGVASVIHRIDASFPQVNLGYNFYDSQGRLVLALNFFGPSKNADGTVAVPGGIYVGSDITPFLPENMKSRPEEIVTLAGGSIGSQANALTSVGGIRGLQRMAMKAASGQKVMLNGQSLVSELSIGGVEGRKVTKKKHVQQLMKRFSAASMLDR